MIVIITVIFVILSGKDIGEMKTAELRGSLLRKNAVPMMSSETAEVPMKPGLKPSARIHDCADWLYGNINAGFSDYDR